MAKLTEGNRIWTAAAAANVSSANDNELQDQLIAVVEEQEQSLMFMAALTGTWENFEGSNEMGIRHPSGGSANEEAIFAVPLRVGQKITDIIVVASNAGAGSGGNGGSIKLRRKLQLTAVATGDNTYSDVTDGDIGGANPFAIAAPNNYEPFTKTVGHVIVAGYTYAIVVQSSGDATYAIGIVDVIVKSQMGN